MKLVRSLPIAMAMTLIATQLAAAQVTPRFSGPPRPRRRETLDLAVLGSAINPPRLVLYQNRT